MNISMTTVGIYFFCACIFEALHAWEEYHFGFEENTSGKKFTGITFFSKLSKLPQDQSNFLVYKIMMVIGMFFIMLFVAGGAWSTMGLLLMGLYFTYQLHHVLEYIVSRKYNPGLITAIAWVPFVILWWKFFAHIF